MFCSFLAKYRHLAGSVLGRPRVIEDKSEEPTSYPLDGFRCLRALATRQTEPVRPRRALCRNRDPVARRKRFSRAEARGPRQLLDRRPEHIAIGVDGAGLPGPEAEIDVGRHGLGQSPHLSRAFVELPIHREGREPVSG